MASIDEVYLDLTEEVRSMAYFSRLAPLPKGGRFKKEATKDVSDKKNNQLCLDMFSFVV